MFFGSVLFKKAARKLTYIKSTVLPNIFTEFGFTPYAIGPVCNGHLQGVSLQEVNGNIENMKITNITAHQPQHFSFSDFSSFR